nr:hypothetical protein [Streptomyces himastatinicus]
MLVFGLVALAAAVSASAIAYWLNRDAVLTRTQGRGAGRVPQGAEGRHRSAAGHADLS